MHLHYSWFALIDISDNAEVKQMHIHFEHFEMRTTVYHANGVKNSLIFASWNWIISSRSISQ